MNNPPKLDWNEWLDDLNDSLLHSCYEIGEPIIVISADDNEAAEHWLRGWTPTEYANRIAELTYY